MNDIREQILSRLLVVCSGITGVQAAARNQLDVNALYRPAIIILDGSEEPFLERPNSNRKRFSEIQMMDLSPEVRLLLRADDGSEGGNITSLFRGRTIDAILNDTSLQSLVGTSGAMWYRGCSVPEPSPETKEPRLDLTFVFTYVLRLSDLT